MRYLILSDIHSNWDALEAVLRDAEGAYDRVLCLGDLVGYGAEPNQVVAWVREHAAAVVRGNHDKACVGLDDLDWFNPTARSAALWTEQTLTPENLVYLRGLPRGPVIVDGFQILHGSPLDEDEYLISVASAAEATGYLDTNVSFFGHTHLQGGFFCHRNGVRRIEKLAPQLEQRSLELDPYAAYLINPGSVGQPRDGDARAAYAVYTPEERLVEYRRTGYPIEAAQRKIREAGLPDLLADRLESGT